MSSESKFSRRDFLKVSALGAAGALLMPSGLAAAAKSKKNEKTGGEVDGVAAGHHDRS